MAEPFECASSPSIASAIEACPKDAPSSIEVATGSQSMDTSSVWLAAGSAVGGEAF